MKKVFVAVFAALILLSVGVYAEEYSLSDYEKAQIFINSVAGGEILEGEKGESVKRSDFLKALISLMNINQEYSGENVYIDVVESDDYFSAVGNAYTLGWIDKGNAFLPSNTIKLSEAVKIVINAIGYEGMAQFNGGYPSGYMLTAERTGLLRAVSLNFNEELNKETAAILFKNALTANTVKYNVSDKASWFTTLDAEVLEESRSLKYIEGVITEIGFETVALNDKCGDGVIKIDGKEFQNGIGEAGEGLLGCSVRAYYDSLGVIRAILPRENRFFEISTADFNGINGGSAEIYENDRKKELGLESAYKVIYNGRRVKQIDEKYYKDLGGTVRFLDNGSGRYNFVFIESWEYAAIDAVDLTSGIITASGISDALKLDDADRVKLLGADGDIQLFEISKGDIAAIKRSADMGIIEITVLGSLSQGGLSKYNKAKKEVTINSKTYKLSRYAIENCISLITPGDDVYFYEGLFNDVAAVIPEVQTSGYGYLIKIGKTKGLSASIKFKLLNNDNRLMTYTGAKNIKLDGKTDKAEKVFELLGGAAFKKQLIKFELNERLEICLIDTAEDGTNVEFGAKRSADNSLIRNAERVSLRYKNNPMVFSPKVGISSAVIFTVPGGSDITDNDYQVIANTVLQGDALYDVDVYDVNEYGSAGAIVIYKANKLPIIESSESYMVESVGTALDKNGEVCIQIHCWRNGTFYDFTVPNSVQITKRSGSDISAGDIIRVWYYNQQPENEVERIVVDVDYSNGTVVQNTDNIFDVGKASGTEYITGKVFSAGEGGICIAHEKTAEGKTALGFSSMRMLRTSNPSVAFFNSATQTIETGRAEDIITYKSAGENCQFAIIRSTSDSVNSVFIYK